MANIFPQGKELIDIIEGHGWLLYDVTQSLAERRAFTWEELQDKSPVVHLEQGSNYIFVPKPKMGQTLREAYSLTKGLGPSLTIENPNDERWLALYVKQKVFPGTVALFTRLFLDDYVVATSPKTIYDPDPDFVAMPYDSVVDTFRKYLRIIQPEEVGAQTPIPLPFIPEMN